MKMEHVCNYLFFIHFVIPFPFLGFNAEIFFHIYWSFNEFIFIRVDKRKLDTIYLFERFLRKSVKWCILRCFNNYLFGSILVIWKVFSSLQDKIKRIRRLDTFHLPIRNTNSAVNSPMHRMLVWCYLIKDVIDPFYQKVNSMKSILSNYSISSFKLP